MAANKRLKTSDIAKKIGVHPNTVRLFEAQSYLPPISRADNGYRQFTPLHLEQARLTALTLRWPYVTDREVLIYLVRSAACGDYGTAMELAYQNLVQVRTERTYAESAIEFLERWATGYLLDSFHDKMHTTEAAQYLRVTVDMLRNWERNGLISVPRDPTNGYRLYGAVEFGRLRVIRMLVQSGYSLMAILRMLQQFDEGKRHNLRDALELPPEDSANEYIGVIADRWLSSLIELEERAQKIIQQVGHLIEMTHQT
jgi:DNA-binding transcriptional MerR regulator